MIELLITIAVLGVLFGYALPGTHKLLQKSASSASINQTLSLVRLARNEAINLNRTMTLCPSFDGNSCHNDNWEGGVLLFSDSNGNSKLDGKDEVKRFVSPFLQSGSLQWRSLRNRVQFNSRGMVRGTAGSFVYCPENRDDKLAQSIVISFQGRARIGRDSNQDGIRETGGFKNIDCS